MHIHFVGCMRLQYHLWEGVSFFIVRRCFEGYDIFEIIWRVEEGSMLVRIQYSLQNDENSDTHSLHSKIFRDFVFVLSQTYFPSSLSTERVQLSFSRNSLPNLMAVKGELRYKFNGCIDDNPDYQRWDF